MVKHLQPLKLVPAPDTDPLEGFEPLLLSSVEMLDIYWLPTAVILQRVVDEAMHGEMTIEDIYERIKSGAYYCVIVKSDTGEQPEVALAIVMEMGVFPQYSVLNITAIGGRQLDLLRSKFWHHLCSWAFMNGVRTMQASVSPAMARVLKNYGFKQTYITVRKNLTEM